MTRALFLSAVALATGVPDLHRRMTSPSMKIDYPSLSTLAEPPVAIVASVVDKKGTRAVSQAYLEFLYTPEVFLKVFPHCQTQSPSPPRSSRSCNEWRRFHGCVARA